MFDMRQSFPGTEENLQMVDLRRVNKAGLRF